MGVKIRQKIKGKGRPWWVFITHNGQRTSRKVGSKKAAETVAGKIEAKLKLGEFSFEEKKKIPTFKEYSKKWLNDYIKVNRRQSTYVEYESILRNHLLPVFKNQRIDEIGRGEIRDFLLSKYSDGLSQARVVLFKNVMGGLLEYALDSELISVNPTAGLTKWLFPKSNKRKLIGKDKIFTHEELNQFLDTCEKHFPEYYLFFLMAARTGMRLGELLPLTRGDIDLKNGVVSVSKSYRVKRLTRPKNGKSRKVDMSKQLIQALRTRLKGQLVEVKELMFVHEGRIMEQSFVSRVYKEALEKAELTYKKFHSLRHSFAAHLLSAGISPYYVSQQLGHSGIGITCDVYGEWVSNSENKHVNVLDFQHSSAPYKHPETEEEPQAVNIAGNYI